MNECSQHTLGRNICAIRKELGLSKVEFCLQLGISRVTLDLIEQGRDNVKLSTLDQLARAVGKEPGNSCAKAPCISRAAVAHIPHNTPSLHPPARSA